MEGKGTTYAIFIVRQLHEKCTAKNKGLCMAFVDLEKGFDPSTSRGCVVDVEVPRRRWMACVSRSINIYRFYYCNE